MEFKYIALILCLLLLVFLLFREVKRTNKNWLVWRIIATTISVFALLFLLFPITYKVSQSIKKEEFTYLTKGFDLDSSIKNNHQLYTSDSSVYQSISKDKIKFIPDLTYHLAKHTEIKTIQLYGEGLTETELNALRNYQINFHPSKSLTGIQNCNWEPIILNTNDLTIQGVYENKTDKPVSLILKGLGTGLDSITIKASSSTNFSLKTKVNQSGYFAYQLLAKQNSDTLENQTIPFQVMEKQPIKVLVLASNPDFEYKFLKNWIFKNNYSLALRSRISKDKFSSDFMNMDKINIQTINKNVLNQFDLVIADDLELVSLSSSEKSILSSQIGNGLGLLIRMSELKSQSVWAKNFSFNSLVKQDKNFVFQIFNQETNTLALQIEDAILINPQPNHQSLVLDNENKIWADSKLYGEGKLTVTTIPTTYQWMMKGNEKDYGKYWSELISNTVKKQEIKEEFVLQNQFPIVYEPIEFIYKGKDEVSPKIEVENVKINPLQNKYFSNQWQGTFWANKAGWNRAEVNGKPFQFYVYQQNSWETLSRNVKNRDTRIFVQNQNTKNTKVALVSEKIERTVSKWWFFSLFLFSCAFLWFESKR